MLCCYQQQTTAMVSIKFRIVEPEVASGVFGSNESLFSQRTWCQLRNPVKRNLNYITVQLLLRPSATSNFQILVTNPIQFSMLTGVASQGTSVPAVLAHRNPKETTVVQLNPERASSATDARSKATGPVSAPATPELKSRIQPATSAENLDTGEGGVPSAFKG